MTSLITLGFHFRELQSFVDACQARGERSMGLMARALAVGLSGT